MNKIIDYEYFMDNMTEYEIELCMKNMHFASKNDWEQTRMMMWASISPYLKKGQSKSPAELLPLATDEEEQEQHDTDVSNEEFERLQEYAKGVEAFFASQQKQQNDIDGITS